MKYILNILFAFILIACSESEPNNSFDNFINLVKNHAEVEALNCGFVTVNVSSTHTNMCVTNSYNNSVPFYIYKEVLDDNQYSIKAISMSPQGNLKLWSYSGSRSNGIIVSSECQNPMLTDYLTDGHLPKFECSNL